MRTFPLLVFLLCLSFGLSAQPTFPPFQDGIYYAHESLLNNAPEISLAETEITMKQTRMGRPHRYNRLQIKESNQRPESIDIGDIYAVCFNQTFFVRAGEELVRIIKFGALCHFTMEEMSMPEVHAGPSSSQTLDGRPVKKTQRKVGKYHRARQFVLDLQTGEMLPFDTEAMGRLLERDPELYNHFEQEAKKEERLFLYLLDYNRRNLVVLE